MSPKRDRPSSSEDEKKYVRLKPYDKGKGHTTRRFMVDKFRFFAGRWHILNVKDIKRFELDERRQKVNDLNSALMFDIVSKDEAMKIDEEERRIRESAPDTVKQAVDLTGSRSTR